MPVKSIPQDAQNAIDEMVKRRHDAQPKSFDEQLELLTAWGQQYRKENTRTVHHQDGTESVTTKRMPARMIADRIEAVASIAKLGETDRELESAPLVLYVPDRGIYTHSTARVRRMILALEPACTIKARNEVEWLLDGEATAKAPESSPSLIPVGNGIYNTDSGEFQPFTPEIVFTSKIATNYNPNATEPSFNGWKFSDWVNELAQGDEAKRTLIWQMIASIVKNRDTANVFFAFVDNGQGRTGKSTLEQLLMNLVGKDNYTSLKLDEFGHDFKLANAYGARLIIGDDNEPKGFIDDGSNLKSIVTNETVLLNPKGAKPFTARFFATVVQSMNGVPTFRDKSGGLYRRFRMLNFPKQYPDTPAGKRIKNDYIYDRQLLEWILKKALEVDVTTIIDTKESQELVYDTRLDNDPVLYFVEEVVGQLKSIRLPTSFLFNLFCAFMKSENSPTKLKQRSFTKQVRPYMEDKGWKYDNKSLTASKYFNQDDMKLVHQFDDLVGTNYPRLAEQEVRTRKGIFYRDDKAVKNRP